LSFPKSVIGNLKACGFLINTFRNDRWRDSNILGDRTRDDRYIPGLNFSHFVIPEISNRESKGFGILLIPDRYIQE